MGRAYIAYDTFRDQMRKVFSVGMMWVLSIES